ncbi:MAG: tRNA (adenosine(37)-N6)-threonylcarbamoyltransferase complex ATPase subunit type 1 TsaE [Fibrobacterota bacterium]
MTAREWTTRSPEDTQAAGAAFAAELTAPVAALYGDLGSGKTCFVKGAARALGVTDSVNSPTYALVNWYRGARSVAHIDAYRLKSPGELFGLGFEDILAGGHLCFIEWADKVESFLPADTVRVRFTTVSDTERRIEIVSSPF